MQNTDDKDRPQCHARRKSMREANEKRGLCGNYLGDRLPQVDENRDFGQDIDAFRPNYIPAVD